jgi:hypothetical protein
MSTLRTRTTFSVSPAVLVRLWLSFALLCSGEGAAGTVFSGQLLLPTRESKSAGSSGAASPAASSQLWKRVPLAFKKLNKPRGKVNEAKARELTALVERESKLLWRLGTHINCVKVGLNRCHFRGSLRSGRHSSFAVCSSLARVRTRSAWRSSSATAAPSTRGSTPPLASAARTT